MSGVVIVGASETARIGVIPDQSAMGLACEAALLALADAGLTIADVDGLASTQPITDLAFTLGVRPRWIDGTVLGGTSNLVHIRHAMAAIETGARPSCWSRTASRVARVSARPLTAANRTACSASSSCRTAC